MPFFILLFQTILIYTKRAKLGQSRQGGEDVFKHLDGLVIKYESIPSTGRS